MRIPDWLNPTFRFVAILICIAFWGVPVEAQSYAKPKTSSTVAATLNADGNTPVSTVSTNTHDIENTKTDMVRQQTEF